MGLLMRKLTRFRAGVAVVALAAALAVLRPASAAGARPAVGVLIFAAASLQTALDAIAPAEERATSVHMTMSYAASSALARQIESRAPADLFISADLDWMDYLDQRHLIRAGTRVNLLGNALVLIAPKSKPVTLKIMPGFALAAALGGNRIAIADPAAVPAGKYAKAALTGLGVWDAVSSKVAAAEDVRAALRLVSRGEAPLGIVYKTDTLADNSVVIVDTFPASSHPAITYPIAMTTTTASAADAEKVLDYLKSPAARTVFERQGFAVLPAR
jgi:molybdate transport system substrate-binding protein